MSADPNKKSGRSFQCRDVLWETFEQMARELECSVDYLINEAMKQYARQRSYGGASRTPTPGQRGDAGGMPHPRRVLGRAPPASRSAAADAPAAGRELAWGRGWPRLAEAPAAADRARRPSPRLRPRCAHATARVDASACAAAWTWRRTRRAPRSADVGAGRVPAQSDAGVEVPPPMMRQAPPPLQAPMPMGNGYNAPAPRLPPRRLRRNSTRRRTRRPRAAC